MNPQAEALNKTLLEHNASCHALLSQKGLQAFFPKKGILSQAAEAKGKKINATIGLAMEDDGTFMCLESVNSHVDFPKEDVYPYAPSYGKPALRKKWQEMLYEKNPHLKLCTLPVVSCALSHGLYVVGYLFLNDGDSVITPDLFWGNYRLLLCNGAGAELDTFPSFVDGGFNIAGLEEKLMADGDKKVVLLNFPNNPTGYTPTVEEAKQIVAVIKKAADAGKKIVAVSDDAYFGLVYEEGVEKESLFAYLSELHENVLAVKVDGPTKEDYAWGFRVGFVTYAVKGMTAEMAAIFEEKTAGAVRGTISNVPHLSQSILLDAYQSPFYGHEKDQKFHILNTRYEKVKEVLAAHSEYSEYFTPVPYNSGYFMCVEIKNLDTEALRQHLLEKYDTGVIANTTVLRVAYSCINTEQIPQLFDNIYHACQDLSH